MIMKKILLIVILSQALGVSAQTLVGDKWVDNNLSIQIVSESLKKNGIFEYCLYNDQSEACVQNLSTGIEVKVLAANGDVLWEGVGTGRAKRIKVPVKLDQAYKIRITAFKAFVVNKTTGNKIHQDEPMMVEYIIE